MQRPLRAGRARFELAIGKLLYVLSRDAPSANSATFPNSGVHNSRYFSVKFQVQILKKPRLAIFFLIQLRKML